MARFVILKHYVCCNWHFNEMKTILKRGNTPSDSPFGRSQSSWAKPTGEWSWQEQRKEKFHLLNPQVKNLNKLWYLGKRVYKNYWGRKVEKLRSVGSDRGAEVWVRSRAGPDSSTWCPRGTWSGLWHQHSAGSHGNLVPHYIASTPRENTLSKLALTPFSLPFHDFLNSVGPQTVTRRLFGNFQVPMFCCSEMDLVFLFFLYFFYFWYQ